VCPRTHVLLVSALPAHSLRNSGFTEDAGDYVTRVQPRVVLIDGWRLADLMIEYDVGVSRLKAYELKRVDEDYFVDDEEGQQLLRSVVHNDGQVGTERAPSGRCRFSPSR
jgi:hypothetical protein